MPSVRTVIAALCAGLVLAACGGSSSTNTWQGLRSVRVTVARPGLPPPYGAPKTVSFTTPTEVARATKLLNAFHITRRPVSNSSQGCGGGSQVVITVVPQQGRTVSPRRPAAR